MWQQHLALLLSIRNIKMSINNNIKVGRSFHPRNSWVSSGWVWWLLVELSCEILGILGPQELPWQIWAPCVDGELGPVCELWGNSGLFSTSAGQTCSVQPWTCSMAWTGLEGALGQDLGAAVTTQHPVTPLLPREQLPSAEQPFLGLWGFHGLTKVRMGIPSPCSELPKNQPLPGPCVGMLGSSWPTPPCTIHWHLPAGLRGSLGFFFTAQIQRAAVKWENAFSISVPAQGISQGQTVHTPRQQQQLRVSLSRTTWG